MTDTISFGQAIGIIGGVPILKNVLGHTVDQLKIPRHLDVGSPDTSKTTQGLLSGVLSGGIGSFLQSPVGSLLSSLTGAIAGATASLSGIAGTGSLVTALTGLQTSAASLSALADNIVGFANGAGYPTQLDVVGYMSAAQSLGSALPANLSLATALAPVSSSNLLASAQGSVGTSVAAFIAGTMSIDAAVATMSGHQAELDAITTASINAIRTVVAAQTALCAAQSAIALLVGGPPEMIAAMKIAIRPSQMAAVQAILDAHKATIAAAAGSQNAAAAAVASVAAAVAANSAQRPALSS